MTAVLEGGEWSAAHPGYTLLPGKTRCPCCRRLGGSQGRSGWVENLDPTWIWSRTVRPVVSRYTNWATRPTWSIEKYTSKIICIFIHSSFCVLNFMSPTCRPHFAEVSHTSQKIEWSCLRLRGTVFCFHVLIIVPYLNFVSYSFIFL